MTHDGDFDIDAARDVLRAIDTSANHGKGQVYEPYHRDLLAGVDAYAWNLEPGQKEAFLELAEAEFDYRPEHAREAPVNDGSCVHGLDADTCPCGCFEGDGPVDDYGRDQARLEAQWMREQQEEWEAEQKAAAEEETLAMPGPRL